jgi:hypothetical protein
MRYLLVLHQFLYLAELFAARLALVLFEKIHITAISSLLVALVPALPTQIAFYLPGGLGMVVEHPKLAIAHDAKVHPLVIIGVLFLEAGIADKRA